MTYRYPPTVCLICHDTGRVYNDERTRSVGCCCSTGGTKLVQADHPEVVDIIRRALLDPDPDPNPSGAAILDEAVFWDVVNTTKQFPGSYQVAVERDQAAVARMMHPAYQHQLEPAGTTTPPTYWAGSTLTPRTRKQTTRGWLEVVAVLALLAAVFVLLSIAAATARGL